MKNCKEILWLLVRGCPVCRPCSKSYLCYLMHDIAKNMIIGGEY